MIVYASLIRALKLAAHELNLAQRYILFDQYKILNLKLTFTTC